MTVTATAPLPVTVLGGYLGAGKTTLLNHLLRHAGGRRIGVLVNDFGEIAIDAALIEARDGDVLSLAGGCVCCSIGSDLVGALRGIAARRPALDHAVIETSGVALPATVAAAVTLVPEAAVDAVVVVADASTVRERARDRYVGDVVAAQLAAADLLVLSRRDLVDEPAAAALAAWLGATAPGVPVVEAIRGAVPPEVILGLPGGLRNEARTRAALACSRDVAASHRRFAQASRRLDEPLDPHRLAAALTSPTLGLLRAKAIVRDGSGRRHVVQLVGARCEVAPFAAARRPANHAANQAAEQAAGSLGLVCIGLCDRSGGTDLEAALDAALEAALVSARL